MPWTVCKREGRACGHEAESVTKGRAGAREDDRARGGTTHRVRAKGRDSS